MKDLNYTTSEPVALHTISATTEPRQNLSALRQSIEQLGLLQPILIIERAQGHFVLDGQKRLAAWRSLHGENSCIAARSLRVHAGVCDATALLLRMHIQAGVANSNMTIELARLTSLLESEQIRSLAPWLLSALGGLDNPSMLEEICALCALPTNIKAHFAQKKLPLNFAAMFAALPTGMVSTLEQSIISLSPSASEWRQLAILLFELHHAGCDSASLIQLISEPIAVRNVISKLQEKRYPQKMRLSQALEDEWRGFQLSKRVHMHRSLEQEGPAKLQISFESLKELEQLVVDIQSRLGQADFRGYVDRL